MQNLANRVALDDGIEVDFAVIFQAHMNCVGVAEEIVQVAENLLVSAEQKRAEVVRLTIVSVQFQGVADIAEVDELIDLAVRIAGDVAKHGASRGWLIEAMNGHDRKQLLDGPAIRHRLEDRKIAEISIGQQGFQSLQLFGNEIHLPYQFQHFAA